MPAQYAETVRAQCKEGLVYTVPQGEGSKSLAVYQKLLEAMLEAGFGRGDAVVAVGGGVGAAEGSGAGPQPAQARAAAAMKMLNTLYLLLPIISPEYLCGKAVRPFLAPAAPDGRLWLQKYKLLYSLFPCPSMRLLIDNWQRGWYNKSGKSI